MVEVSAVEHLCEPLCLSLTLGITGMDKSP